MNAIWARSLIILAVILFGGATLAMIAGATIGLGFIALALLALALLNAARLSTLWRLLDAPSYGEVPSATGAWGEAFYRLHRLAKRWHLQVTESVAQHERFLAAIQASPNGVMMLDANNRIEWCNANAEAHFGIHANRDAGQPINYLVRSPAFLTYLSSQNYDTPLTFAGKGSGAAGAHRTLSVQAFPYGDDHKLVLSHDITDLEKTDAMRRDFVANVSHELKTPLTVLSGFLETVRELKLAPAERERYLDIMAQQSQRMQHIVDDLLVLAKIEGQSKPPADVAVDVPALIATLRDDAFALSAGKHRIEVDIDPSLTLLGNAQELSSAFGNLISNAIRYTPQGGLIRIGWHTVEQKAAFVVTDSGIGIPAEHVPRLTERFYRVDSSRSRDTGGTGLGLAIVKHVLQRHNARLQIESTEGRGSTFSAVFPSARVRQATPRPALADATTTH
ncbi:phosphate regulon sensor histidine kinase PhoR [Chitinasiproducens palmae]|uniref:Phosphate regulon sensor protein PhoR n=1 Tax=Chitinasiproducens palmae TaxID=1770053 RepID=A0A1H2PUZ3_9BURK|nr:phosphate regulon sensor histidine kinase PhoR [Chitinasiproducens palmae]SDV51035.1 two-component system, OmpR family, phosphate regulon sensor histidine kinase PhoR [Chitinasiproducens palmae]